MATKKQPATKRKSRQASDLPTVRSLQAPDVRDLIPRSLKEDFQVTLWLAGYREGVTQGHLEMRELMEAAAPRVATPGRASRPAIDPSQFEEITHESQQEQPRKRPALATVERIDTAPDTIAGEDPDAEDGADEAERSERPPAEDEEPGPAEPSRTEHDMEIGESGYVRWIEDHYIAETQRMSTHPKKAKAIALDILANKVVPDPNGLPPARIAYILETALINAKIHQEVDAAGFRDHHQGAADSISDGSASTAAARMGATALAEKVGL